MQMRETVGKSWNTVFFQWFVAPEGGRVGSLKRRVRSQLARWEMKNCTPFVARSTFRSQNVQNTSASDHFWKLRCRKSARRCGAKHISKSKRAQDTLIRRTTFGSWDVEKVHAIVARSTFRSQHVKKKQGFGSLLEVQMSKKCTPLWREAHFEVKVHKTHHSRTTFASWDVEKVHAVVARSTCRSQNVQNTSESDHFWKLRCRKSARRCGAKLHIEVKMYKPPGVRTTFGGSDVTTRGRRKGLCTMSHVSKTWGFSNIYKLQLHLHYITTTLHSNTLHYTATTSTPSLHYYYTTLHYTTLQYVTLHYTPLHYITLHDTTFHYTSLHYTTLHSTTLQLQLHNYTPLHPTSLNYTTLHYITLHYTTFHYTSLHYTTLHSTTLNYTRLLHYTTLHYIPLHSSTLHYIILNDTAPQIDR